MKPILKYAGGKSWLVDLIRPHFIAHVQDNPDARLVEPFCGGAAISLGIEPENAWINDINQHVINFYQHVQKKGFHLHIGSNTAGAYYDARKAFNSMVRNNEVKTKAWQAELFYYLNKTCFNGLCRFNSSGEFNVPYGKYKRINYAEDFEQYYDLMKDWTITCHDFEQIETEKDDFLYIDPPYFGTFANYSEDGFYWEDQLRLAEWLKDHKGPVVVSNTATDDVLKLYESIGFRTRPVFRKYLIAASGSARIPSVEMIAWKNIEGIV